MRRRQCSILRGDSRSNSSSNNSAEQRLVPCLSLYLLRSYFSQNSALIRWGVRLLVFLEERGVISDGRRLLCFVLRLGTRNLGAGFLVFFYPRNRIAPGCSE
eukprot:966114-Pleurochrysis_carterae.AAC.1